MTFDFTTTTEFAATPDAVFRYITDLRNWSRFPGAGVLPGIAEAVLPTGEEIGPGARVRVRNTDGSVHHERVTRFEPPEHFAIVMELTSAAAFVMKRIEEEIRLSATAEGTRMQRTFRLVPRSPFTIPMTFIIRLLLRRAVLAHNELSRRDIEASR